MNAKQKTALLSAARELRRAGAKIKEEKLVGSQICTILSHIPIADEVGEENSNMAFHLWNSSRCATWQFTAIACVLLAEHFDKEAAT